MDALDSKSAAKGDFSELIRQSIIRNGEYNTNNNDLVTEFYAPILGVAKSYDRVTGSFSASGIKALAKPLVPFIRNAIKYSTTRPVMRIVASHDIPDFDYEQMNRGYQSRLTTSEDKLISILENLKESSDEELLAAIRNIGTMIKLRLLDIKIAIPNNKLTGMFHRKAGLFKDFDNNLITFEGSQNFTKSGDGSEINLEGLVAFCTNEPVITNFKQGHQRFFEDLWRNDLENVEVRTLSDYPMQLLASYGVPIDEILKEIETGGQRDLISPRECQRIAVSKWISNGHRGIFDMCTGSGKSRAALIAIEHLTETPLTVIITGNLIDLIDQWANNEILKAYGESNVRILRVSSGHGTQAELEKRLSELVQDFRIGFFTRQGRRVFVLATIQSASQQWFMEILSRLEPSKLAIIVDEVHHAGANGPTGQVLKIDAKYRIGLSATWRRSDDDENGKLEDYFRGTQSVVAFSYPLSSGIKDGVLSPYLYYVHPVSMDPEDLLEFRQRLSDYEQELRRIDPSLSIKMGDVVLDRVSRNKLPKLLELRNAWRNSLGRAIAKTDLALQVIQDNFSDLKKCIVYCATKQQLDRTSVLMNQRHWEIEPYDSQVLKETRERIRERFSQPFKGKPMFVGAIKCLDEGIDLPALDSAVIVASNRTEREWIQRRGRVLRLYPGKGNSIIHDFVMVPYSSRDKSFPLKPNELDYITSELDRLESFGMDAVNKVEVATQIRLLRDLFSI